MPDWRAHSLDMFNKWDSRLVSDLDYQGWAIGRAIEMGL